MADTQHQSGTGRNRYESTISTGAPVPVALEKVESQLGSMWRIVADAAQARGGSHAVTVAQVLNLIVKTPSHNATNSYMKDIDAITGRHPARVIYAVADAQEEDMQVQALVSIRCQLPPAGGRQLCTEQVTVEAGGEAIRQMPAAIIPLLIQDLPVFLWWTQGTPFDDYLFRNLADSLNRLIVDSATFENPEGTLSKMSGRLRGNWPTVACTDMNWGRLQKWRELTAQFFDGQALRPSLDKIGQVTIEYATGGRGAVNRAQALMLAGWLASRLGWHPVDPVYELARADNDKPARAVLHMRSVRRSVTIHLNPNDRTSDVPGDIQMIKLEVPGEKEGMPEASFMVTLTDDPKCALMNVEIEGSEPTTRNIQLDATARAELLAEELELFSRDRVYEESIDMVGTFIRGTSHASKPGADGARRVPAGEPMSAGVQPRTRPQQPDKRER